MTDPDEGLEILQAIRSEFADFCANQGNVSEADTRAKVIDRILREVLGWPENGITREDRVVHDTENSTKNTYSDYCLTISEKPTVAVEAKRESVEFTFPTGGRKTYSLEGTLVTDKNIRSAIYQVRGYCDDQGIRYAVATNGYAWIVFRAVRDDIGWKKGQARVFPSLDNIADNFTEFFSLLSYEGIVGGSLQRAFTANLRPSRNLRRVIAGLFNADVPLQRNRLNEALQPWIRLVFEDIAHQEHLEVFNKCYVHTHSLNRVANELGGMFREVIPVFLHEQGTRSIGAPGQPDSFEQSLARALHTTRGDLFLLLGAIGSGKTTFLKGYQLTAGAELLAHKTLWFNVDFLKAPLDPMKVESFVWESVLQDIRSRYSEHDFERRKYLNEVFQSDIHALESTILQNVGRGKHKYNELLAPYLYYWQQEISSYVPRLVRTSCARMRLVPALFIDNVDQLPPPYQAQIFLLAQRVVREISAIAIVAMREESYFSAAVQRHFTAFTNRKFHIAAPLFRRMIGYRIQYAVQKLEEQKSADASDDNWTQIKDLLHIVQSSMFGDNRNLVRFIEAICFGNMRFALQLFTTFLTSGATDVGKMLGIFHNNGSYNVAFHEFVKSIMLGDRAYYKEDASPILNLFNVSAEQNASHFTAFRIVRVLLGHRGETTRFGRGFVSMERLIGDFEDVFDNRTDLIQCCDRLVRYRLIEADTRSSETIEGASHVRVTSAGWYYLRYLTNAFAYLDLVLQDTPIDDYNVHREIFQSMRDVDNLGDSHDLKLARVRTRFARVEAFLDYLKNEEEAEREHYRLSGDMGPIGEPVIPSIYAQFTRERDWIDRRLVENREHVADEEPFDNLDEEAAELLDEFVDAGEEVGSRPPETEQVSQQGD